MPMKKGHSPEVVSSNIREMMMAGHPREQAVAAAMASARKYKKMAMGGMVTSDMNEDASSDLDENASTHLPERNALGETQPESVENPDLQDHERNLASALFREGEKNEMDEGYAMGGLVQPEYSDEMLGTKPTEGMQDGTEEPMNAIPMKQGGLEHPMMGNPSGAGLSEEAKRALQEKKMKRRYSMR